MLRKNVHSEVFSSEDETSDFYPTEVKLETIRNRIHDPKKFTSPVSDETYTEESTREVKYEPPKNARLTPTEVKSDSIEKYNTPGKDCSTYENCIKEGPTEIDLSGQRSFNFLCVGCWGVYCNQGEYNIFKVKDGKLKKDTVRRGQKQVSEAIKKYTSENEVSDMYLAGDNVYQVGISANESSQKIDEFTKRKTELLKSITKTDLDPLKNFDVKLQISEGFENCFRKANVERYFLVIGNHDIENCEVLNAQYNYKGWNFPSLYYNVIYKLAGFKVNIIVLDTNMFEDEPLTCSQIPFTKEQIANQEKWAKSVCIDSKDNWNIVIGHIPYLANGHKEKNHPIDRSRLRDLVIAMKPNLYICADEHNMQFIQPERGPAVVVAGSGGTDLDHIPFKDKKDREQEYMKGTKYVESTFGFVSYKVTQDEMTIEFKTGSDKEFSYTLKKV